MPRIAIIDRANMNAEQARVYDAPKARSGIVGGPYYAYIRLPKLFEAAQNMRESLSAGPLSPREQQGINLTVARHWGARYPWFAQARRSLPPSSPRPDQSPQPPGHPGQARAPLPHRGKRAPRQQKSD